MPTKRMPAQMIIVPLVGGPPDTKGVDAEFELMEELLTTPEFFIPVKPEERISSGELGKLDCHIFDLARDDNGKFFYKFRETGNILS